MFAAPLGSTHDLCSRTHDLCSRTHDLCSRTHDLCSMTHDLCSRTHDLCSRTHDLGSSLVQRNYGVWYDSDDGWRDTNAFWCLSKAVDLITSSSRTA